MNAKQFNVLGLQYLQLIAREFSNQIARELSVQVWTRKKYVSISSTNVIMEFTYSKVTYFLYFLIFDDGEVGLTLNYFNNLGRETMLIEYRKLWVIGEEKNEGLPSNYKQILATAINSILVEVKK